MIQLIFILYFWEFSTVLTILALAWSCYLHDPKSMLTQKYGLDVEKNSNQLCLFSSFSLHGNPVSAWTKTYMHKHIEIIYYKNGLNMLTQLFPGNILLPPPKKMAIIVSLLLVPTMQDIKHKTKVRLFIRQNHH